ncbi:DNA polymerase-3 subunit epsilon [Actinokineospora terrae]|uniref:DNA polymerase-3 subunit epsilon n=1 Tax=Actinokineospora terrae TaxID=155974 RepID=A0A1H9MMT6_9PSEU|nr:DNA polymerase-3 subunit epsilon [Actinokineospora terrae]
MRGVGFLDIFRRKSTPAPSAQGFAVIDVETTGLSPRRHRVLELAIVRTDPGGRVLDEWVSRFNPAGPVGATHIHGITAADVAGEPGFADVLPAITERLAGWAVAGHNVRFDLGFLRAEYDRAGWALPLLPAACTLDHSWDHLPHLDRRRLVDCCAAAGVQHTGAHSALGDARATARLLAGYLDARTSPRPSTALLSLPQQGSAVPWPSMPSGPVAPPSPAPRPVPRVKPPAQSLLDLLRRASLADALDDGAPDGSLPYLELLAEVLEDGVVTDDERAALTELARLYALDDAGVAAAHRGFLLSLAHLAVDDGWVSRVEKAELTSTAALLGVPEKELTAVLDAAEAARLARLSAGLEPLPSDWSRGEPLRVGDKVAFTGCDAEQRELLEQRAERLGVRVLGSVSRRTALLVTDGGFSGGKAEKAELHGTRRVHPDEFAVLLDHLQPANQPITQIPLRVDVSPAAVRAWGQANGYRVSDRGRIPLEVTNAYQRAHASS